VKVDFMTLAILNNSSDSDDDMENRSPLDVDRDLEAQRKTTEKNEKKSFIKKKQADHAKKSWFGRSVSVVETRLQCPSVTCVCTTTVLVFILAIGAVIAFVYANNTVDTSNTTTYTLTSKTIAYIVGGVAATGAVFLMLDCFTHIFSCCTIGHYIPKRAFEDNIGELSLQNDRLGHSVDQLGEEKEQWKVLSKEQQEYVIIQKQLTTNLRDEFSQQELKLTQVHQQLDQNVKELEQAKAAMKVFQVEINKTHEILEQLVGSNRQFGEQLQALGVTTEGMQEQQIEWNKDTHVLAGENDEFQQQNQQLQNLGHMLTQQLNMMEQFRDAIAQNSDRITKASVVLDESDDKFLAANRALKETVKQREEQLQEMREVHDQLKKSLIDGFGGVIAALNSYKDSPVVKKQVRALQTILDDLTESSSGASSS